MMIYHILSTKDLEQFKVDRLYAPKSFIDEGFIHCSNKNQVLPTANRRYYNKNDLMLLVIDTEKVDPKIVNEDTSASREKHPHIYGKLSWNAVVDVRELKAEKDGSFVKFPTNKKSIQT